MAENMPMPPEGFQRPGIPGAGNILDPAVRGDLREQLHAAMHGAMQQLRGGPAAAAPPPAQTPVQQPTAEAVQTATPPAHRAGPFAHGDVDLSMLAANVIPVKPNRNKSNRRFYFLSDAGRDEPSQAKGASTETNPSGKPG